MEVCFNFPDGRRICIPIYESLPWWRDPGDPLRNKRHWTEFEQIAVLGAVAQMTQSVHEPISGLQEVGRVALEALHGAVKNLGEGVELVGAEGRTGS